VWGYPCESKSSPAHYSKNPPIIDRGIFFASRICIIKKPMFGLLKFIRLF
jgi:hypothetical protein